MHCLAEVALAALFVGALDAFRQGLGISAICVAIASVATLALTAISHASLRHAQQASLPTDAPQQATVDAPTPEVAPQRQREPEDDGATSAPETLAPAPEALAPTSEAPASTSEDDAVILSATPTTPPAEPVAEPACSTLDFAALSDQLVSAENPLLILKRFVADIHAREAEGTLAAKPCGLERYTARLIEEAGLHDTNVKLPAIEVLRPVTSRMVYLRCTEPHLPYLAKVRMIKLEAALNAARFATASLDEQATPEQAYRLNQGLARSIVAQSPALDEPPTLDAGGQADGEWAVRYGISQAVETLQLPYRLVARYRTNVADGNVAIEFDYTPADAFPSSAYVEGLGIVPTSGDMRQRAAADYALRVGLLLAASAFRCSERIQHVWVAAIHENAQHRTCYYSVDFDRWRFARLDLTDLGDLTETYRSFAPMLRYEDGWLRPVRQGFHLEQERFCPSRRYIPVSLSSRRLKGHVAEQLGCDHVSALAIEEADGRSAVASAIMMEMAPEDDTKSTQRNVRTVMRLAGDDPDPTVRAAAERVVRGLVDGTLAQDAFAVGEEFIRGDALTRAVDRAKELLMRQQPLQARSALEPIISAMDTAGLYDDSPHVAYRYFNSYVERALYNRNMSEQGDSRTTMLVPDAYYEAHLILSIVSLMTDRHEEALAHAQRLATLAPLDARCRLHQVKCLEVLDREDEAVETLKDLLEQAHEPYGVGFAYYRMAYFQWKRGNVAAAQACYQSALRVLPMAVPMVAMELSVLYLQNPEVLSTELTEDELEETLQAEGIPVAPTERTSRVFLECAQAALDAEVFPVARNFANILGAFSVDDITAGVIRSLEDAPDR